MKRIGFLFALLLIALSSGYTQAQFTDQTKTNLGDLLIRFCNDIGTGENKKAPTKSLVMEADTGEMKDICIYVQNSGPTDVKVKLNFVDGTITADESQKKACQPEGTIENFGQYVIFGEDEKVFDAPAGSRVERHAQIKFPEGYAGMSYGCATLQIEGESITKTEGMFDILSRRGNFIDVLVHGKVIPKREVVHQTNIPFGNLGDNNQLVIYQDPDNKQYIAKIVLQNPGNVAQKIDITPHVSSRFSQVWGNMEEKKEIVNDEIVKTPVLTWGKRITDKHITRKLLPNNEISVTIPLDGAIPRWQGNMKVDFDITATPVIDFQTDTTGDTLTSSTKTISSTFFAIPRNIIILIVLLLFFLLLLTLTKKKKENQNNS